MATYSAFHNFRVDFWNPGSMVHAEPVGFPSVSSTRIDVRTSTGEMTVFGNDFAVNFQNETATGTVTGFSYSENGHVLASVSGLQVDLERVIVMMTTESNTATILTEEFLVSGDDSMTASDANDVLYGGAGNDRIDGGGGFDTAFYRNNSAGYETRFNADGSVTLKNGTETDVYVNVERIRFNDAVLATDIDGNAGQAQRLYQAAFERTPDNEGLKYWIDRLDSGNTTLADIADSFLHSPEFVSTYGTEQTVNNARFVELLYNHTLGRDYDVEGYNYWVGKLDDGLTNRRDLLAQFSESDENKANVADAVSDGIWLY